MKVKVVYRWAWGNEPEKIIHVDDDYADMSEEDLAYEILHDIDFCSDPWRTQSDKFRGLDIEVVHDS